MLLLLQISTDNIHYLLKVYQRRFFEGNKICANCSRKILKEDFDNDDDNINSIEAMSVDEGEWFISDNNNNCEEIDNKDAVILCSFRLRRWYSQPPSLLEFHLSDTLVFFVLLTSLLS